MNSRQMYETIKERLNAHPHWTFHFDAKHDTMRIEDHRTKKGVTISLPGVIAKWHEQKDEAVREIIYYVEETLKTMEETATLSGNERNIYPVIRSTSFPTETKEGVPLLHDDHTAETRIYYALDLGKTYRLIDEQMMEKEKWNRERVKEIARFNVRSLPTPVKEDRVADNVFYFVNTNDGYDASRILNDAFLAEMHTRMEGTMAIAVPHQDVLILADLRNDIGYDVLAQMTMSFFANGRVPITALSFLYENGKLEPIFILGKKRRT
ncbi:MULTISPECIES: DUF1444 domain-containing protein [Geobacillus]|jgi:uncharacterized protein YtpQ (UPF0354 family)|uniref:UPF0354 protein GTNG_2723 n=2 Tax=Geobacillus thermodenitrificans TaxID=33940 RepID=Y2723_GEOTN|nr:MULTISPECIES: DUF1444 domain-containing protein [Geobacillus]A4IRW4.1 RecName: Full=UPF0354 protein GTNG_2723 [Geobacillus thermodenitrificans NG80-2]ABO68068.1 Conserved hypothetical protein [Geobacillus thermodenitrificans NG80-2]ARA98776.1 DUF1444 domain-containing protein [Geobacillus thermodenitrificans]ARP43831.1 hypothetical protein GTHT12_02309 [Geobacillus thermodenitrificans]ATO38129.1 DUF1444 domain-containing protein [Geobacillus thermodenitrificans]KQB92225.1 UPF0354 protein [